MGGIILKHYCPNEKESLEDIVNQLNYIGCTLKKTNSILEDLEACNNKVVRAQSIAGNIGSVDGSTIELNIPPNACIKTIYATVEAGSIIDVQLTLFSDESDFINRYYPEQTNQTPFAHANFEVSFEYPICVGENGGVLIANFNVQDIRAGFLSVVYIQDNNDEAQ